VPRKAQTCHGHRKALEEAGVALDDAVLLGNLLMALGGKRPLAAQSA